MIQEELHRTLGEAMPLFEAPIEGVYCDRVK